MPPIMGAGAFIMSEWTQIPYLTIVGVAFIPAIMYFLCVAFFIHFRAKKIGLQPLREEEIPKVGKVLMEGWNFFLPIGVLMGFLIYGFTPTYAASVGIASIVASSCVITSYSIHYTKLYDCSRPCLVVPVIIRRNRVGEHLQRHRRNRQASERRSGACLSSSTQGRRVSDVPASSPRRSAFV